MPDRGVLGERALKEWKWLATARERQEPQVESLTGDVATGSGPEELLLTTEGSKLPTDWSPDGRFLLYTAFAAICLLLYTIGLDGVVTAHVVERTREVGIRMARGQGAPCSEPSCSKAR